MSAYVPSPTLIMIRKAVDCIISSAYTFKSTQCPRAIQCIVLWPPFRTGIAVQQLCVNTCTLASLHDGVGLLFLDHLFFHSFFGGEENICTTTFLGVPMVTCWPSRFALRSANAHLPVASHHPPILIFVLFFNLPQDIITTT